ncbi:MAG: hypothetical protein HQ558_06025 [Candidatus Omnitrophica bacterium]|nr:hypothetical protein [Candidatus Omnitrophota bacterium]
MEKIITFVRTKEDVVLFEKRLGRLIKDSLIIAIDLDVVAFLEANGYRHEYIWNYLKTEDFRDVDDEAVRLAKEWYRPFEEAFQYHGVALGEPASWHVEFFFKEVITASIAAEKVFDKEEPSIVIFDSDERRSAILKENRPSCANSVIYAVIASTASKRGITMRPVSGHCCRDFVYWLGLGLSGLKGLFRRIRKGSGRPRDEKPDFANAEKNLAKKHVFFFGGSGVDFTRTANLANRLEEKNSSLKAWVSGVPTKTSGSSVEYPNNWLRYRQLGLMLPREKKDWLKFQERLRKAFSRSYKEAQEKGGRQFFGDPFLKEYFEAFLGRYNVAWWDYMTCRVMELIRPEVVVVRWPMDFETDAFRRTIDKLHSKTKILYIPHGSAGMYNSIFFKDYAFAKVDKVASGGEIMNLILGEKKVPADRCVITGFQEYDRFSKLEPQPAPIDSKGKEDANILVVTGGFLNTIPVYWDISSHKRTMELVASLPQLMPGIKLFFKPHPRFDFPKMVEYICKKNTEGSCSFCPPDIPLGDLLCKADIVVSVNSGTSACIETLFYKKPAIMVLSARSPYTAEEIPIVKWGGAECLYKDDDIVPTVKKILHNADFKQKLLKRQQTFLERYVYKIDGHATERIIDLIACSAEGNS